MANILVVDDDENLCAAFRQFLSEEGHNPIIVSNAQDAIKSVKQAHPDLVIMDIRMPGISGLEALTQIRQADPNAYVVIITAYGTSQTSIEAIRLGAFEYLMKPLDLDDVRAVIDKALEAQALRRQIQNEPGEAWEKYPLVILVGRNPRMQAAYKMIGLLTTHDVPALIEGERGTGKQLVARTIHSHSGRKDKPFLAVNCRALEAEALEAELFGHAPEAGGKPYAGKIEAAAGGTVFIQNVTDMPLAIQSKLLHS
jgi:DNA-binding NtrC family response regulator